mmetsp:Transcript_26091/g.83940  ORF Transcript_26091/g.83940 Transcript_26091/m.83940 type:complete len:390 (-) Transcript_26091:416-1585(-)
MSTAGYRRISCSGSPHALALTHSLTQALIPKQRDLVQDLPQAARESSAFLAMQLRYRPRCSHAPDSGVRRTHCTVCFAVIRRQAVLTLGAILVLFIIILVLLILVFLVLFSESAIVGFCQVLTFLRSPTLTIIHRRIIVAILLVIILAHHEPQRAHQPVIHEPVGQRRHQQRRHGLVCHIHREPTAAAATKAATPAALLLLSLLLLSAGARQRRGDQLVLVQVPPQHAQRHVVQAHVGALVGHAPTPPVAPHVQGAQWVAIAGRGARPLRCARGGCGRHRRLVCRRCVRRASPSFSRLSRAKRPPLPCPRTRICAALRVAPIAHRLLRRELLQPGPGRASCAHPDLGSHGRAGQICDALQRNPDHGRRSGQAAAATARTAPAPTAATAA